VIANITNIIIASAAVIGLVPLGIRTVFDMIKNHRRKKNNDMWLTVAVSVIASHVAPPVAKELLDRMGAVAEQLPPWAKAALGANADGQSAVPEAPASSEAPQAQPGPLQPSNAEHGSPNGSSNTATV
jgi:hypothetical protein